VCIIKYTNPYLIYIYIYILEVYLYNKISRGQKLNKFITYVAYMLKFSLDLISFIFFVIVLKHH